MTPNRSWNPPRERTHHTCLFDSWSLMKSRGDERSFFCTFVSNFKMRHRDQVSRKPKVEDGSRARLERRPYAVFEYRARTHTSILKNPYPRKEERTWKNMSKEEGGMRKAAVNSESAYQTPRPHRSLVLSQTRFFDFQNLCWNAGQLFPEDPPLEASCSRIIASRLALQVP